MAALTASDYLAAERYIALKPVRDRGRCVLLFPNTYELGMSSLALQTVWAMLNRAGVSCERAFLPEGGGNQVARSLESGTPLGGFDFVLITSSFELDRLNIPRLLEAGGVPVFREARGPDSPVVIAGGPAVTANPLPLSDLVDACWIGELEPAVDSLARICLDWRLRDDALARLASPASGDESRVGAYVPSLDGLQTVGRLYAQSIEGFSTETAILTPHTTFADRFLIEVGRGCGRSCCFCLARRVYHPVRARSPQMLLDRIDRALAHTDQVGLIGAALSDYPRGDELFTELLGRQVQVSVSSVRAEGVSDSLLALLARSAQETLTIAPEAGSEDLRRKIGKPMLDEQIIDCIYRAMSHGMTRFKLYFILGLPGESRDDVGAIGALVKTIRVAVPEAMLSVSINPFVPKPHTPFEDEPMAGAGELRRRMAKASSLVRQTGVGDVTTGSVRWSEAQGFMIWGGADLGKVLAQASLAGGSFADLRSAARDARLGWPDPRPQGDGEKPSRPWDIVDCSGCCVQD